MSASAFGVALPALFEEPRDPTLSRATGGLGWAGSALLPSLADSLTDSGAPTAPVDASTAPLPAVTAPVGAQSLRPSPSTGATTAPFRFHVLSIAATISALGNRMR